MSNIRCIVLGATPVVNPNLEPIKFLKIIDLFGVICKAPNFDDYDFDTIELVSRDYGYISEDSDERFDLIFAYLGDKRSDGILFLGHWNDGVL